MCCTCWESGVVMGVGFEVRGYRRVHVYADPRDLLDVARFIAGALLLSHGIRRDTVAVVKLGDSWLVAPGDRVRHLRPDEETLEGWIKAVLRGAMLGVVMVKSKPSYDGYRVCLSLEGSPLIEMLRMPRRDTYVLDYSSMEECDVRYRRPGRLREYMLAPLVNMIIDNIEWSSPE
jgi:hypothetical protein